MYAAKPCLTGAALLCFGRLGQGFNPGAINSNQGLQPADDHSSHVNWCDAYAAPQSADAGNQKQGWR